MSSRPARSTWRRRVAGAGSALAVILAAASPSTAEIVVLTSGDFLKVDGYEVGEADVRLELPFGGTMTLPLLKVVHILDDELAPEGLEPELGLDRVELGFAGLQEWSAEWIPEGPLGELIVAIGRKYDLNPRLLAAIVAAESSFEPAARSPKGAMGLMQVMPATAQRFGVEPERLYDPSVSLDVGARFLVVLRERFTGDLALMLAAYNAGEATVERFGGVPPYRETQTYIERVHWIFLNGWDRDDAG